MNGVAGYPGKLRTITFAVRRATAWIDVIDLGCVMDHTEPLPHPAIDQLQ